MLQACLPLACLDRVPPYSVPIPHLEAERVLLVVDELLRLLELHRDAATILAKPGK